MNYVIRKSFRKQSVLSMKFAFYLVVILSNQNPDPESESEIHNPVPNPDQWSGKIRNPVKTWIRCIHIFNLHLDWSYDRVPRICLQLVDAAQMVIQPTHLTMDSPLFHEYLVISHIASFRQINLIVWRGRPQCLHLKTKRALNSSSLLLLLFSLYTIFVSSHNAICTQRTPKGPE